MRTLLLQNFGPYDSPSRLNPAFVNHFKVCAKQRPAKLPEFAVLAEKLGISTKTRLEMFKGLDKKSSKRKVGGGGKVLKGEQDGGSAAGNRKLVVQLSLEGDVIARHDSMTAAAASVKVSKSSMSWFIQNGRECANHFWRYVPEDSNGGDRGVESGPAAAPSCSGGAGGSGSGSGRGSRTESDRENKRAKEKGNEKEKEKGNEKGKEKEQEKQRTTRVERMDILGTHVCKQDRSHGKDLFGTVEAFDVEKDLFTGTSPLLALTPLHAHS